MTRGKEHYKQNIVDNAPVQFFAATNTAMMEYPFVLGRPDECSPTLASQADTYILDSGIGDDSITSEQILDRAEDIGADVALPADELNDLDATTEATLDMLEVADDHEFDGEIWISLQADEERDGATHVDHYERLKTQMAYLDYDIEDYSLAVGGIRDWPFERQLEALTQLREHVGVDTRIHALGLGTSSNWIAAIRRCPWLIDSFDNGSMVKDVMNGKFVTKEMDRFEYELPRGSNSTVLMTELREFALYMYMYMIGSDVREEDTVTELDASDRAEAVLGQHIVWKRQKDAEQPSVEEFGLGE